jgi:hypothetical protein
MNFAVSLALYASIQKEKGQPFIFPGNEIAWNSIVDHSDTSNSARLIMLLGILLVSVGLFLCEINKISKISLLDFVLG